MSDFPGEDKKIPKRLIEAVAHAPVDYLVPKLGLSNLLDSEFETNVIQRQDVFATQHTKAYSDLQPMSFDVADDANQELLFRRPRNMSFGSTNQSATLFDGLSPLASRCLAASAQVSSDNIKESLLVQLERPGKHSSKSTDDGESKMEFKTESSPKRIKTGSGISMNRVDLGDKYIQELTTILGIIKKDDFEAAEYWYPVVDDAPVLSETCLAKLSIIMKNILSVPSSWHSVESSWLVDLLKILVGNIECATQHSQESNEDRIISRIAHASTSLIFTIFMISKNDKRLFLEQFVSEPTNFMSASFEYLLSEPSDVDNVKDQTILLQQSISLLPSYIDNVSFIDESLVFKFVYLFAKLLMTNASEAVTDLQLQNSWYKMKDSSRKILVTLFQKVSEQREFILEELLSHGEQTPVKRNQKKLRKVGSDIFVTDFTLTIVSMLETLNCSDHCKNLPEETSDKLAYVKERFTIEFEHSTAFGSRIADVLLNKLIENPSSYRHVIENYVYDLIALLPYPQYSISQHLLDVIFKKLLTATSSPQQQSANVETTFLQLLGATGASIFEIKCATRPNEGNNLIKLVNYPESLPQFISSYENCLKFCLSKGVRHSGARYLWNQVVGILLKAVKYTKDDKAQSDKFLEILFTELNRGESLFSSSENVPKIEYLDIKYDYYSFLHAFDLMNLYEPYLKVLLTLLESEKIKMKSTAIKCLSMLASHDKAILFSPMVKHTIGKTLENSPASVKDAILDLINRGSSAEEYYQQINHNYDDESTLIRKRVLKMNEKIYIETGSQQIKATVASRILLRMEDEEDSIIEMARDVLLKQWISSITEEPSPERQVQKCREVIRGMAGVASINEKCSRHFEWFLNFYLLNGDSHSPETYVAIKQCLNKITDVLVQTITELQASEKEISTMWNREHLLFLLAKFADCNVSFITKNHIIALYPYLMSDERSDIQYYILHVFRNILEKDSTFSTKFLHDLETTLLSRLPRMKVKEISEAMPLIWCVATHRNDTGRVLKACSSCFQHLTPYVSQVTKSSTITAEGKLQRLIYLATGFARYCHFTTFTGKPVLVGEDESVYAFVAKRLIVLSRNGVPHVIRRVAIKNLVQLSGSHPNLFNSKPILSLIDGELESASLDIKLVILESLYDFFTAEERRSILKTGVNGSISSNERLKKKLLKEKRVESVNDGVCSALITRFLRHILKVCRLADIKSSLIAVRLLKLTLQYGYTNPSHCIPTFISLIASTNDYMRHVAIEMLTELFEKYETMVFSGITPGVKLAIEYSQSLQGRNFSRNKLFLNNLQNIVGMGKKNSTRYFKSVFKVLKVYFNKINGPHTEDMIKDSILFISANLCSLSFPSQFELAEILNIIELQAEQLTESLVDEYQDEEEINVPQNVENTFVVLECLKRLKSFLIADYGLKIDISTVEGAQALELKKKHLTSTSKHDFSSELEKLLSALTGQVILDDLTKMVRQAS